jgi:hypothetical protein
MSHHHHFNEDLVLYQDAFPSLTTHLGGTTASTGLPKWHVRVKNPLVSPDAPSSQLSSIDQQLLNTSAAQVRGDYNSR